MKLTLTRKRMKRQWGNGEDAEGHDGGREWIGRTRGGQVEWIGVQER